MMARAKVHTMPGNPVASALEAMDTGFVLFDSDDSVIHSNAAVGRLFPSSGKLFQPGTLFSDLAEGLVVAGIVDAAETEGWLGARPARNVGAQRVSELRLADGRWLRVKEVRLANGGTAAQIGDISESKDREVRLVENENRYQRLTEIGIALSAEKNTDRLLEVILLEAMSIANADGGTIYLRGIDGGESQPFLDGHIDGHIDGRIDRRSGGDRRSGRDRRTPRSGSGVAYRGGKDRRDGVGRRVPREALEFALMRNDSLGIAMGGTTGERIPHAPLPLYDADTGKKNLSNVATRVAHTGRSVNIADAYATEEFDVSGAKAFDKKVGYRSTSFLTIPMLNKTDEVIGVLQLINARDPGSGATVPFGPTDQQAVEALASQAAVALDNQMLFDGQKRLLDSFIQLMADAVDKKSPYTGGHCKRVPALTEMLAEAACEAKQGPFKDFDLTPDERYELHIAAWLHDCGKIATPEHIVDKASKLSTIYDRIESAGARFEVLRRDAEIEYLRACRKDGADTAALERAWRERVEALEADHAFIEAVNRGGESMGPEEQERVRRIGAMPWRAPDGEERPLLSEDEVYNLCVSRGTLTPEERKIIDDHIVITIEMLANLPFPKGLTRVPEYAGGHHEKMDGTGFPRGLRREQMSTPARMMAIADIFEALTAQDRPYKKPMTLSQAMAIMARMRDDDHIDPELFELFIETGIYRSYAERFLAAEQIDDVDVDAIVKPGKKRRGAAR